MSRLRALLILLVVVCTAEVHADEQDACARQNKGRLFARTELLFGLSRSSGPSVTEVEFQRFLDAEVTPRFPDGLTLLSGDGQFKSAAGRTIREDSKLLILLYVLDERRSELVDEVRDAYKKAFAQQSVLRTDSQLCVSF